MKRRWFRRLKEADESTSAVPQTTSVLPPAEREHLLTWIKTLMPSTPDGSQHEAIVGHLLSETATGELPGLDFDMRWRESWRTHPWESMSVADASRLLSSSGRTVAVAAGLSMHRNGYIRESAVAALVATDDPQAVRWLVLRCGDWVPEVRDAALVGVESWLSTDHADVLIDVLPVLQGGRFSTGRPAAHLRARVEAVLEKPEARAAIEASTLSSDRSIRRSCVRLLVKAGSTIALLERVAATNDVVAISTVAGGLPTSGEANHETGRILLESPLARFRAEGLWRLTKDDDDASSGLVRNALSDSAPSVRDVAQRWLVRHGQDPNAVYRDMLDSDPVAALRGLGDRPDSGDAEAARRAVVSAVPAVRLAALRLLAGVGATSDGELFARRFLHGSAKERRLALAGMKRSGTAPKLVDDLWAEALAAGSHRQIERIVHQVLPLAGKWKRLDIGMQALAVDDAQVVELGFVALRRALWDWNRGYPSRTDERDTLRSRLDLARPVLTEVGYRRRFPMLLESLESLLR